MHKDKTKSIEYRTFDQYEWTSTSMSGSDDEDAGAADKDPHTHTATAEADEVVRVGLKDMVSDTDTCAAPHKIDEAKLQIQ